MHAAMPEPHYSLQARGPEQPCAAMPESHYSLQACATMRSHAAPHYSLQACATMRSHARTSDGRHELVVPEVQPKALEEAGKLSRVQLPVAAPQTGLTHPVMARAQHTCAKWGYWSQPPAYPTLPAAQPLKLILLWVGVMVRGRPFPTLGPST